MNLTLLLSVCPKDVSSSTTGYLVACLLTVILSHTFVSTDTITVLVVRQFRDKTFSADPLSGPRLGIRGSYTPLEMDLRGIKLNFPRSFTLMAHQRVKFS